jgi:integrase
MKAGLVKIDTVPSVMNASGDKLVTNGKGNSNNRCRKGGKVGPAATVKFGSASVPIYLSESKGRKRYFIAHYRDGKRIRKAFPDLAAAKKEAMFVAQRIQSGMQHVTDLKPHERDNYAKAVELLGDLKIPLVAAVEDYVQARKLAESESLTSMATDYRKFFKPLTRRATVRQLIDELLAARKQDGASKTYVSQLKTILNRFAEAFPGEILGISSSDIDAWLRGLDVSASSRNSMLVCVKVLFSYARSQNCLPAEQKTAAEQLKKVKLKNDDDVAVFTPKQMEKILHAAPPHLIPILAIGAFAGIRMAELNRLDWSAFDLERGIIELRAGQAKTASRRIIPITDNLRAWIEPLPRKGRVVRHSLLHRETTALARALKLEWPRNVLRHSFISYRIAKVKSADQVALEAGNSPSIIFKNYRELATEEQADEWFGILPKDGQWENDYQWDHRARIVTLPDEAVS